MQLPPSKGEPGGRLLEADESLAKGNAAKLRGLKPFFKQVGATAEPHTLFVCVRVVYWYFGMICG